MNENEILARWLGFVHKYDLKMPGAIAIEYTGKVYSYKGEKHHGVPNFRTSNEWAGALLEKLADYGFTLVGLNPKGQRCWFAGGFEHKDRKATWRDAVVDAALAIIKAENETIDA